MSLIFNNARSVREISAGTNKTEAALQAVIVASIAVAVAAAETFTCTASASGYSQEDVQNVMRKLINSGYGVSYSGSTLTLTW